MILKAIYLQLALFFLLCVSSFFVFAGQFAGDYSKRPDVIAFIQEMHDRNGFDKKSLAAVFAQVEKKPKILDAISKPAESKMEWVAYRRIFLTDARIDGGVAFWRAHKSELEAISQRYQVDPAIIVAIIGVETSYGKNMGSYRVADALTTLAFDYPKRSGFFLQELEHFLLLSREQKQDPLSLKGSYAGAMGYGQFMPSSFRNFAVDFNGDGFADIWNNPGDAAASVANYFQKHGWEMNGHVLVRAKVSKNFDVSLLDSGLKPQQALSDLASRGVSPVAGGLSGSRNAVLIKQCGELGEEFWLGLNNFYVITRYNQSTMYAMATHQLSDVIKSRYMSSLQSREPNGLGKVKKPVPLVVPVQPVKPAPLVQPTRKTTGVF